MDRSPGFGSMLCDFRTLHTWFPFGSVPFQYLTSPASATRRTVLQKVRGSPHKGVPQLADTGFQVLFHSPPGVLFTFPSQYYALSVTKEYLALEGGPSDFPQGSTCLVVLWILSVVLAVSPTGLSPSMAGFPKTVPLQLADHLCGPNPSVHARWFRLCRVRSPLLPVSMFLSLPPAT